MVGPRLEAEYVASLILFPLLSYCLILGALASSGCEGDEVTFALSRIGDEDLDIDSFNDFRPGESAFFLTFVSFSGAYSVL